MHQFSFDFGDPYFALDSWRVAVRVVTFENTYGIDRDSAVVETRDRGWLIRSSRLMSAGGQVTGPGHVLVSAERVADGVEVTIAAEHHEKIRSVELLLRGLPIGQIIGRRWEAGAVPPAGIVLRYPFDPYSAFALHTPLVFLAHGDNDHIYFRSLDSKVRCKRFAFFVGKDGSLTAELIHEESAHQMSSKVTTPPWRIGRCLDPSTQVEEHLAFLEAAHALQPWETRPDVPDWARKIALVVTLHGMHWTGYVFNTYGDMIHALEWISERIDGRRVLALLPGWEGRYYWQYGAYQPDPRLGGPDGFRRLSAAAKSLGVRLMPMFGANCANAGLAGFREWGERSRLRSASGLEFQGNKPDWDNSRSHDPGWQAWLNPGAPKWREHLLGQVGRLASEHDLHAAFFDTQHIWDNDPSYPVYEGLVQVRDQLKERFPDFLVVGEGWYDALGAVTPISQVGAPARWEWAFSRYCRTFAHLMWGDPCRASSGVHEAGTTGFGVVPDAPYWLPTVSLVDGTLKNASEKVEQVIRQAQTYSQRYLG